MNSMQKDFVKSLKKTKEDCEEIIEVCSRLIEEISEPDNACREWLEDKYIEGFKGIYTSLLVGEALGISSKSRGVVS